MPAEKENSGLYYYRLRYYDPEAGRFVSRDPLGMWGDPGQRGNAQNYCGNSPINRVDPLGRDERTPPEGRKVDESDHSPRTKTEDIISWKTGGQVYGSPPKTDSKGHPSYGNKKPFDLDKVERWLRVALRRLRDLVDGKIPLRGTAAPVRDAHPCHPATPIQGDLSPAEVLRMAKRTLEMIEKLVSKGKTIKIAGGKTGDSLKGSHRPSTGEIVVDLDLASSEHEVALAIMHELIHSANSKGVLGDHGDSVHPTYLDRNTGQYEKAGHDNGHYVAREFFPPDPDTSPPPLSPDWPQKPEASPR